MRVAVRSVTISICPIFEIKNESCLYVTLLKVYAQKFRNKQKKAILL